ncbi:HAD family hydrolase [Lentzea sp. BCCO 10_0856]|uniref:HAD family hydrolase n=1 Tax=Lentzea miocenica TaxID=3095431 RepID=A0ABU4T264_9PSEU|nr:HAD family hydrolase [Lentzea sp. BCCO 10_0856]MDX8032253.1 HAD family hydrolase [Lentzea sp. BCCO 10_0856]
METPRLVASDVDGTLLGVDERVSERTAAAVARVLASETPFVLVTGRPPRWVPMIARDAGVDGYAICANGAVLYDIGKDEVLWQRGLESVLMNDIADALDAAVPGVAYATERVGSRANDPDVPPFVAEHEFTNVWPESAGRVPRAEMFGHRAVKMLVRHTGMTSAEMAMAAREVLGDDVTVTYSSNSGLIEIAAAGVTKATGLEDVTERYGIPRAAVVAFGDMPNDVPMLSWAGHGVAMGNAHPEAVEVADEITASHAEDGVAVILERWF